MYALLHCWYESVHFLQWRKYCDGWKQFFVWVHLKIHFKLLEPETYFAKKNAVCLGRVLKSMRSNPNDLNPVWRVCESNKSRPIVLIVWNFHFFRLYCQKHATFNFNMKVFNLACDSFGTISTYVSNVILTFLWWGWQYNQGSSLYFLN